MQAEASAAAARSAPVVRRRGPDVGVVVAYVFLTAAGLVVVFPFLWMVAASFKPLPDIYTLSLIPRHFTWDNYRQVLAQGQFGRWYLNSLIVAVGTTVTVCFFDALTGYTIAKLNFRGRGLVFVGILSTLMIPTEMLIIPWYILSVRLHWVDTYWGLAFPGIMSAFGVFLMRQFFQSVPNDLLDAGRIDGVGEFGLFWRIALPQVRPALAALAIFNFLGNWNAFIWPVIVTQASAMRTLPVAIAFYSSENATYYNLITAAATLSIIPLLIVFFVFQRQIIRGIVLTGLKG
jgi:multiple sugar transport system permease protein